MFIFVIANIQKCQSVVLFITVEETIMVNHILPCFPFLKIQTLGTCGSIPCHMTCASHFDCQWINVKGGKRPSTLFHGILKSYLQQVQNIKRSTVRTSSDVRRSKQGDLEKHRDTIKNYTDFKENISKHFSEFNFEINGGDITMFKTDKIGKGVIIFVQFKKIVSPFGDLKLVCVEKNGVEISKKDIALPQNSFCPRWSQLSSIIDAIHGHEPSNSEYLDKAIEIYLARSR